MQKSILPLNTVKIMSTNNQPVHPIYTLAEAKVNEIESELKKLGRWEKEPAPAGIFEGMGAFGAGKMSFEQWLQWVLIPRVREVVKNHGEFPTDSQVGVYSMRELGADADAAYLSQLLYEFDRIIYEYKPDLDWATYMKKVLT